jgi:hypothetical protein
VPDPPGVEVSVEATFGGINSHMVSSILVVAAGAGPDQWIGTATMDDGQGGHAEATVTWQYEGTLGTVRTYTPVGSVRTWNTGSGCTTTITPDNHAINPSDGVLTVDYANPTPFYSGTAVTVWDAQVCMDCGEGDPTCNQQTLVPSWFVAPGAPTSEDGNTIAGTVQFGGATYTFEFHRSAVAMP